MGGGYMYMTIIRTSVDVDFPRTGVHGLPDFPRDVPSH